MISFEPLTLMLLFYCHNGIPDDQNLTKYFRSYGMVNNDSLSELQILTSLKLYIIACQFHQDNTTPMVFRLSNIDIIISAPDQVTVPAFNYLQLQQHTGPQ